MLQYSALINFLTLRFGKVPNFGEWRDGHILLQDHGDEVFFRNIKILVPAK